MVDFRTHIRRAIELKGSQSKLAADAGCTQQAISFLLTEADRVSPEMAARIDRATGGQIAKEILRPDIFGPVRETAA